MKQKTKENIVNGFNYYGSQATICEMKKSCGENISYEEIKLAIKENLIEIYNGVECNVCKNDETAYQLVEESSK